MTEGVALFIWIIGSLIAFALALLTVDIRNTSKKEK